jgi:hypothetical protein
MKTTSLLLVFVLSGISVIAQNNADLKLNPEKNVPYRFRSSSEQTISQTVNGIQQNTSVTSSSTLTLKMVDATPDFSIAEVRFDTINTTTNAMGVTTVINSAVEGKISSANMSDVMSCIMNRLSKNALYVKMDPTGKVIELINARMLSDIILKDTNSVTGQTAPMIKMQIRNMINEKALTAMVESFTYNLPGRSIAVGEKWDVTTTSGASGMSLDIMTSYLLNDITGNDADITAESNIKASDNAAPMEYSGARITYGDLKGISKSNLTLNVRTGLPIDSKAKTRISGNLNVSAQGMEMQIPMEINIESRLMAIP